MSEHYLSLSLQPKDLPEIEVVEDGIKVNGWHFDHRDVFPVWDDVLAWAAAVRWYEQHPEVVPDGD